MIRGFHSHSTKTDYRLWYKSNSQPILEISYNWGLALSLCKFSNDEDEGYWSINVHLGWPQFFIALPLPYTTPPEDPMLDRWGFSLFDLSEIHLDWGHRTKIVHLPWEWQTISHEVRTADGTYEPYIGSWEDKPQDNREKINFSYTYKLESGDLQHRIATVYVERWTRRMRWLKWTSWFEWVDYSINVEFSNEVGERTGSWKGGCIGCSYTMLPGETPEQTIRRMERERKF